MSFPADVCKVGPGLNKILLQDVVFRIMECDLWSLFVMKLKL